MAEAEIWSRIKYSNYYISTLGRVKDNNNDYVPQQLNDNEQATVLIELNIDNDNSVEMNENIIIKENKVFVRLLVYKLVIKHFMLINKNRKYKIIHINNDKTDNCLSNLKML